MTIAYRLTRKADAVLSGIDEYACLNFGEAQADAYLLDWDRIFVLLSHAPSMGEECDELGVGLRRLLHMRHVAFYRVTSEGIVVIDIIDADRLPERHLQSNRRPRSAEQHAS
ncbi:MULTISPECIES: type II toxin-antitoxin system RelE/ParE family toxin [Rhizobium]|uniref:Type II toxin-antitoxin system RelE/ParE family toxin n=1 Tax=Rhizobium laguerreae TaxID=1076926 RepID=A0A7Y2W8N1_9HYPH|nr:MULTISPECIES: type II toxin-antitoxin system RelE/ParE family toxin [Rhizobium]MBW8786878.1 type II toxin-antitoxin system RelE/ParE family toxin [Rhizobium leguminosarum]MBY5365120.1 type II toxin-antitoxin system RelE/ParE family toxin [Rhizobium leguminosarum]MBY5442522.1 type II toxin-antitoxin system RelE/ParE family toxin [Rhizobium leguminosarum]MBY5453307.1 type II toxin-antitoxin system RelE/ParE family toxin [Rhizobium leguminosarum]NNG70364.1 type II toxin-antitoxin system RelE/P